MSKVPFDAIANEYDREFTNTITGSLQRKCVYNYLKKFLRGKSRLKILELNCGTGEDALWLSRFGHEVVATDISEKMIAVAKEKGSSIETLRFEVCSIQDVAKVFEGEQFDLVFSNFAGLNCLDSNTLSRLNLDLELLLKPNGTFIAILFGKKCFIERIYFMLKGERYHIHRRQTNANAFLDASAQQLTWYYSLIELQTIFSSLTLKKARPIGLFIPPSYLEKWTKRLTFIVRIAAWTETWLAAKWCSDFGDHIYLEMKQRQVDDLKA